MNQIHNVSPKFWLSIRQGLLLIVDAIEREFEISPTTAEMRQLFRKHLRGDNPIQDEDKNDPETNI